MHQASGPLYFFVKPLSDTGLVCNVVGTHSENTNQPTHQGATMNTELTSHETFWLARYAHNKLAPLVKLARDYDPSFTFSVEMNFDHPDAPYFKHHHLEIYVRANGQPNTILCRAYTATTKAQIDELAVRVRDFIQTEQAALEAAHDAAAEADYDDLGYEVSDEDMQDFEAQQERIRERAELERDEDARDIELQNIAAGN